MKNTPKLRFKEFTGEWEENRLSNIGNAYSGLTGKTKEHFSNGNSEYITYMNVFTNIVANPNFTDNVIIEDNEKQNKVIKGDLFFTSSSETPNQVGMVSTWNHSAENLYLNSFCFGYRLNNLSELNNNFLAYLLRSNKYRKEIYKLAQGSTRYNISKISLMKMKICLPTKQEQGKITTLFSFIDKKFEKQQEKVQSLNQYKKGIMQKIFNQEIRFKDDVGQDYPAWQEKRLGEIATICTGKKDTKDKISNGKYPFFVRSQQIERINSFSFDGEAILTAGDGVGVGKVFHYINGKFDFHQRVYKLSNFSNESNGKYIYYYIKTNFIKEVTKYTAKTSVDSVRMEMLTKMIIPYPTLQEQQKIASFLSALDKKIEKEDEKLNELNKFKKGLLQQMFV